MTVILLEKNVVTFVNKSNTYRIDLSITSFIKLMQNRKYINFLRQLSTNPNINYMYNHLNDYHFFKGFVNNSLANLQA